MTRNDRASLIAATQAGNAMVELMRFHAEGPAAVRAFDDVAVICFLAEALKLACDIEIDHLEQLRERNPSIAEEILAVDHLRRAAATHIEAWAG
ncbi:hypothetical protein [Novosphingobium guangzhouense]|nr:hypothetical protein [Novosphingobium guangzhouense]